MALASPIIPVNKMVPELRAMPGHSVVPPNENGDTRIRLESPAVLMSSYVSVGVTVNGADNWTTSHHCREFRVPCATILIVCIHDLCK